MTDVPPPAVIVQRDPGVVAMAGAATNETIRALGGQPVLLLIILLNMIMIGTAGWFFIRLEDYRHKERLEIMELIREMVIDHAQGHSRTSPETR